VAVPAVRAGDLVIRAERGTNADGDRFLPDIGVNAADDLSGLDHLQRALGYWDEVVKITRPLYRDMPLTHYNGNSRDANPDNLFHWARIRDEVAQDVEIARTSAISR